MLFLLNDVVLNLDASELAPPVTRGQFGALTLPAVIELGQELFAADPMLHKNNTERARRLAGLIFAKEPKINAALFVALQRGCDPRQVTTRYAQIGIDIMAGLYQRQKAHRLTPFEADRAVWQRMAA